MIYLSSVSPNLVLIFQISLTQKSYVIATSALFVLYCELNFTMMVRLIEHQSKVLWPEKSILIVMSTRKIRASSSPLVHTLHLALNQDRYAIK